MVVPAGPLRDKDSARRAISAIETGGSTDLSAGYLRGLQEARRVVTPAGGTVLLVSDGHANAGVMDPDTLGRVAAEAAAERITTSALGFGLGYDERLLSAIARGGQGNELFAEEADTATALIAGEVERLLAQVAQAASLRIRLSPAVAAVTLLNDLPTNPLDDGVVVELGAFYAGENRRLVLKLSVPGIPALGLAQVGTLELTHVALPELVQHTGTVPVHVNVVPGDEAAGRTRNPTVVSEALFQTTQQQKKEASRLLSSGRLDDASSLLNRTAGDLRSAAAGLPAPYAEELVGEADTLAALAQEASISPVRAAKSSSYDSTRKSRQRGRQFTGQQLMLRWAQGYGGVPEATLFLQKWQLGQLVRDAPAAAGLGGSAGSMVTAEQAAAIAGQLGAQHLTHAFFAAAAFHGGLSIRRV